MYLGASYSNLGTSVHVNTTVRFARQCWSYGIGDAKRENTTFKAIAKCQKGICRLSWLADEDADIVTEDWSSTIQEIWGQFYHHGEFSKFLRQWSNLEI